MYYINRIELGRTLAGRVSYLKGQEAVVIALKEDALTACIGLASEINAWVMVFASLEFLFLFLPVFIAAYFLMPKKPLKNVYIMRSGKVTSFIS